MSVFYYCIYAFFFSLSQFQPTFVLFVAIHIACSAGVFFGRAICSRKRHVETSQRESEMGRVKGSTNQELRLPAHGVSQKNSPSTLSLFHPRTYHKGYYFYSSQSSTVIKSKMAATTILRTRTRFRPPKIRLHCKLPLILSCVTVSRPCMLLVRSLP